LGYITGADTSFGIRSKISGKRTKVNSTILSQKQPYLKSVVNSSINTGVFFDGLCGFTADAR
jgi:hypothetical protein